MQEYEDTAVTHRIEFGVADHLSPISTLLGTRHDATEIQVCGPAFLGGPGKGVGMGNGGRGRGRGRGRRWRGCGQGHGYVHVREARGGGRQG